MPTLKDILNSSKETETNFINRNEIDLKEIELKKIELEIKKQILDLRKHWSRFIIGCIVILLLSQITIIILIGCNVLIYNSTVVISIFFAETFAQIISLAFLVVNFLFKGNK